MRRESNLHSNLIHAELRARKVTQFTFILFVKLMMLLKTLKKTK